MHHRATYAKVLDVEENGHARILESFSDFTALIRACIHVDDVDPLDECWDGRYYATDVLRDFVSRNDDGDTSIAAVREACRHAR